MPGEIAEMMLDGVLCQGCGEYMGDGQGFPGFCAGCSPAPERRHDTQPTKPERARWRRRQTVASWCPLCGSRKTETALVDHMRDAHDLQMTLSPVGVAKAQP